jgi:hypothetical protein
MPQAPPPPVDTRCERVSAPRGVPGQGRDAARGWQVYPEQTEDAARLAPFVREHRFAARLPDLPSASSRVCAPRPAGAEKRKSWELWRE